MKIIIIIGESFTTILIGWAIRVVCCSDLPLEAKAFMSVCLLAISILFIVFSEIIRRDQ